MITVTKSMQHFPRTVSELKDNRIPAITVITDIDIAKAGGGKSELIDYIRENKIDVGEYSDKENKRH